MDPKLFPAPALALALVVAQAGCSQTRPDARKGGDAGGSGLNNLLARDVPSAGLSGDGRVIEPKRCALRVLIVPRPLHDKDVDEAVWSAADEQVVPPDVRRALQANGLRVGVITGGLPASIESVINAPPPKKLDPAEFNLPDGDNTLVSLVESSPQASVLLNLGGHAFGRDYKDASGWFRVTATHDGPTGVSLRFVPEVHHGPIQRRYDSLPNGGGQLNPMQFMLKDGQQEETLRDLAATLNLQPGQVAAIGCDPDRRGSLGSFLFTQPEPNSDRLIQKVVLVWASRNETGVPGSLPKPPSRLFPVDPPGPDPREKNKASKAASPA